MKCDNLQRFKYSIWVFKGKGKHETAVDGYNADEVDEAIAELKQIIEKNNSAYYVDLKLVSDDIEKLRSENEDLKNDLFAVKTDEGMRERSLRMELWSARVLALRRFDVDEYLRKQTHCNSKFWNDGFNSFNEACKQMQKAINIAEAKCLAKAKEYK